MASGVDVTESLVSLIPQNIGPFLAFSPPNSWGVCGYDCEGRAFRMPLNHACGVAGFAFSASSAAISLAFFALFGMIFFLTQYLQDVRGYSALDAGLRTLPVAAGLVIGGPLSAKLTERLGIRVGDRLAWGSLEPAR